MKKTTRQRLHLFLLTVLLVACGGGGGGGNGSGPDNTTPTDPVTPASVSEIIIGVEYAFVGQEAGLAQLKVPGVKLFPERFTWWNEMQPSITDAIDFSVLDEAVLKYQRAGFTEFTMGMRHGSNWASREFPLIGERNPTTAKEFLPQYEAWFGAVVERYDMDGIDDLPGLLYPVRYYEIGVEFSSFEPEPVEDYLEQLEVAYRVAHAAYDDVIVAHAAFLTINAFDSPQAQASSVPDFSNTPDDSHGLADIRKILDRPDLFDVVNVHSLGHYPEIEHIRTWLDNEMTQRGYEKPLFITDTAPTPFIAFGRANDCAGFALGTIIRPATEADRCRLAQYFQNLLAGDAATVDWARNYVAQDTVKRVIVAAEQGFALINTAFTEDIPFADLLSAGTGNSHWSGMLDTQPVAVDDSRVVLGMLPPFYALQQLQENIRGYDAMRKLAASDDVWLYEVTRGMEKFWIGWVDDQTLYLPNDDAPTRQVSIEAASDMVRVESLAAAEQAQADAVMQPAAAVLLGHSPVYIYEM